MFLPEHLPIGFVFPDDLSHMTTSDATRFLAFIRKRQEEAPDDVFQFQCWLKGHQLITPGNADEEEIDLHESDNGSTGGHTIRQAHQQSQYTEVDDANQHGESTTPGHPGEGSKSGLQVADREIEPIQNGHGSRHMADEDNVKQAPQMTARSKGKEHAKGNTVEPVEHPTHMNEAISGSVNDFGTGSTVADTGQAVPNVTGDQGTSAVTRAGRGTVTQPDQSRAAQSPSDMQPQESSLKYCKLVKKPKSKGKGKADISKADHMLSQGPVTVPELTCGDPKSIVQLEKERLKAGVATRQPTPAPSKARLAKVGDRYPTPGPSNIGEDQQKNTLEPDGRAVLRRMTEHVEVEALHIAYKEVPVIPLELNDAESKAAELNHNKRGPPLKSAMKQKAPPSSNPTVQTLQANSNGQSNDGKSDRPIKRPTAPDETIRQVVKQAKKSADASMNLDTASGQASEQLVGSKPEHQRQQVKRMKTTPTDELNRPQGSPMKWDIEDKLATPPMKIPKDDEKRIHKKGKKGLGPKVRNSDMTLPAEQLTRAQGSAMKWDIEEQPATPPMKIPKDDEKRIGKKGKKGSGPRVRNSDVTLPAEQLTRAQDSAMKWDIEEQPATPLMKVQKGECPDVSPEKRVSQKGKKGSGPRVRNSERTLPTEPVASAQGLPEAETPRRSGHARQPPPPPDADFKAGQPKAKKCKMMD
ncbi:hypothetical protein EV363DRAFT_1451842 [Boletus edulis]|nr:hypothetical protein EV363DRAFT_1451842 [Boletus edulis]